MKRYLFILGLMAVLGLAGCATTSSPAGKVAEEEWPTGIGTIPPSWYDYNPALKHWFDPWYTNPYISR